MSAVEIAITIFIGVAVPLLVVFLGSDSDIKEIDGELPRFSTEAIASSSRSATFLLVLTPRFTNKGFKRGHIERVEAVPVGLGVIAKAQVRYVDRTPIRWRRVQEIRVEVVWVVESTGAIPVRLHYFDEKGNEVKKESVTLHIAEARPPDSRVRE